jgi:hypothetical protein
MTQCPPMWLLAGCLLLLHACRDKCRDDPKCLDSAECKSDGASCQVGSSRDCRGSKLCELAGECEARPDDSAKGSLQCRAENDADCKASTVCKRFGHCVAKEGGCAVGSDEDCRRSSACTRHGACAAAGWDCVPGSPSDCERSEDCRLHGLCHRVPEASNRSSCEAGLKTEGPLTLPRSLVCPGPSDMLVHRNRLLGQGHPYNPCRPHCNVVSDEDCVRSEGCKAQGLCSASPPDSVTGARQCVASFGAPAASSH